MTGKTITLLAILAFVTLTLGSFIWFIVTWDPSKKNSVTQTLPPFMGEVAGKERLS
ncbi:MAG: hypothetical protein AAF280_14780 [Pseudomonadota bacterium]